MAPLEDPSRTLDRWRVLPLLLALLGCGGGAPPDNAPRERAPGEPRTSGGEQEGAEPSRPPVLRLTSGDRGELVVKVLSPKAAAPCPLPKEPTVTTMARCLVPLERAPRGAVYVVLEPEVRYGWVATLIEALRQVGRSDVRLLEPMRGLVITEGHISVEDVLPVVEAERPALFACFAAEGADTAEPNTEPVQFFVAVTLDATGKVVGVAPRGNAPAALVACVAERVRAWSFPDVDQPARFEMPIVFHPAR